MREPLDGRRELLDLLPIVELVERLRNQGLEPVQLLGVERLLDVVVRALPHRLHRRVHRCLSGDDDALGTDAARLHLLQKREAVELRHHQVGERDAERVAREAVDGLLAIERDFDLVSLVGENGAQPFRDRAVVIGNQDLGLLHAGADGVARTPTLGNRTSRTLPCDANRTPYPAATATSAGSGGGRTGDALVTRRKISPPTVVSHAIASLVSKALSTLRATTARTTSRGTDVRPLPSVRSATVSRDPLRRPMSRARRSVIPATSGSPGSGRANARSASIAPAATSN